MSGGNTNLHDHPTRNGRRIRLRQWPVELQNFATGRRDAAQQRARRLRRLAAPVTGAPIGAALWYYQAPWVLQAGVLAALLGIDHLAGRVLRRYERSLPGGPVDERWSYWVLRHTPPRQLPAVSLIVDDLACGRGAFDDWISGQLNEEQRHAAWALASDTDSSVGELLDTVRALIA